MLDMIVLIPWWVRGKDVRVRNNIIANYISKGWNVVSVYFFVPIYLQFLGIEAYGLVGFYLVLQAVLTFADMGLTATLSRELARLSGVDGGKVKMSSLVRTIELLYLGISIFLALSIYAFAVPIASSWLNDSTMPLSILVDSIRLMGVAIALEFPARLYMGGLYGLQRQILANSAQIILGIFRSGGAAIVLWQISSSIILFFAWQVLAGLVAVLMLRQILWGNLPGNKMHIKPEFTLVKSVLPYSLGMAVIAIISIILMQIDKLAISKMISLEALGFYTLANTVAQAPALLSAPISVALFPRLTQLIASGNEVETARTYHRASQLVASIIFPVGLSIIVFSRELILLWTQSADAANEIYIVTALLVAGSIALAAQSVPFRLALAKGWTNLPISIGIVEIILVVPLLIFLVRQYGMIGAGISWLTLNAIGAPIIVIMLHLRLLKGHALQWFLRDTAPYFLIPLTIIIFWRWVL